MMKSIKLILVGISLLLFGICAILLSELDGVPTFQNGVFQLLGLICPFLGLPLSAWGTLKKQNNNSPLTKAIPYPKKRRGV